MGQSLYRFSEVEAKTAKPATLQRIIADLLAADDDACYIAMEAYLRGTANTGSRSFDHAYAVNVLLEHDKKHGGRLHVALDETRLSRIELWERLSRELQKAGFKIQHGKLVGLMIEDKSGEQSTAAA